MKKNIVIIILLIVIVGLSGYFIFGKLQSDKANNSQEEAMKESNKKEDSVKTKITSVFCSSIGIQGLKSDGSVITLVKTENGSMFCDFDISNEKLYYIDNQYFVHTVSLNDTLLDTKLNIKVNEDKVDIMADGKYLIATVNVKGDFIAEKYNLEDGSVEKLSLTNLESQYFMNDRYYYSVVDEGLKYYDINTKEISKISNDDADDARIISVENNYILYADYKSFDEILNRQYVEKYYLYNMNDKSSSHLNISDVDMQDLIMIGDKVYYKLKEKEILYEYDITNHSVKEIKIPYDASEYWSEFSLIKMNETTLMLAGSISLKKTCKDGDCPSETKIYYYNQDTNTLQEVKMVDASLKGIADSVYVK